MKQISYWQDTVQNIRRREHLEGEQKTDVAIIGAGFTGLSSALFLRQRGYSTIVVDQWSIGSGASGRNGSLMLIGYKKSLVYIAKKFGINTAKEMLQLSLDGIELLKEIVTEHEIDCELENKGSLFAAYRRSHFENMKREQQFMYEKLRYENFIVEEKDMGEEIGSDLYVGGLIDPNSYYFHPLKYAIGLAEIVENMGGKIYERSKVNRIEKKDNKFHVYTSKGCIIADELVVATNGYTTTLTKKLAKSIIPMNSNMIATERLDETVVNKLIPKRRGVFDSKNLLYYFRISSDHRLLFGTRVAGPEDDVLYEKIRKGMLRVFPELEDCRIDYKWGGKLAVTMNMFPHVGKLEDGTHFALGYSGHGVSLSTLMGKLIAENIADRDRDKCALEKLPFRQFPFHDQKGIILNLATNYFRFKDAIAK